MAKLKVLFCSSEVVPFAKTGGLADVAGSLPLALGKLGVDVRIAMPKYSSIKISGNETTIGENIKVYFINNKEYFSRDGLYGNSFGDYPDNLERFSFYAKKVLELIKNKKFVPDIIHCHDWQAALIIIYLKTIYRNDPDFEKIKTILTIHNLAYQGIFARNEFPALGLDWGYFTVDALEFYNKINILKGGIVFADLITTVSKTYAREIETKEFGCGLEGILEKRSGDTYGIINGIDYNLWNPSKDKYIFKQYDISDFKEGKSFNKLSLQKENNLKADKNIPLVGLISRLADQKGIDLVSDIIEDMLERGTQFILLGTGDNKYHILFEEVAKKYKRSASINLKFDAVLAQKIYAGCDLFLIPSRFEPCGLSQMISLKYGTIPVVRKTGGLADTITDFNPRTKKGNGFVFEEYEPGELLGAIKRAFEVYKDKKIWDALIESAMKYDFSWEKSAKKYAELYNKVLNNSHSPISACK